MTAKLIVICGLPFSGKTTLGAIIANEFAYVEVDVDGVKEEMFGVVSDDALSQGDWTRLYAETDRRIEDLLDMGHSVVDSSRNFHRSERERAKQIAERANAEFVTIYLNTPESVCRERWRSNRVSPTRRDIEDSGFEALIRAMEAPASDEKALVLGPARDIESWFADNAQELTGNERESQ